MEPLHLPSVVFIFLVCNIFHVSGSGFSKNEDYAVLRGTSVVMPCVPLTAREEEDSLLDMPLSFHWTTEEEGELTDSRFQKQDNGEMLIVDAHVADCGIYMCKVQNPSNSENKKTETKIFKHKLIGSWNVRTLHRAYSLDVLLTQEFHRYNLDILVLQETRWTDKVYDLSGHKFISHMSFGMAGENSESVISSLRSLLTESVCRNNEYCEPGIVKFEKCEFSDEKIKKCQFSISYRALPQYADQKCNEDCERETMLNKLKKAEDILQIQLIDLAKKPTSPLNVDPNSFSTRHLITCNAGFHLVKSHLKRCFPCPPGTYSGPNSYKCHLCPKGEYQEHYGKHACTKCPEKLTTDNMGTKTVTECFQEDKGILGGIQKGVDTILSIFS